MQFKLHIKNFQSITDAEFEFKTGITLLVGSTDSGKSSVLRALEYLLTNSSEDVKDMIQHGKKEAEVTLTGDGIPEIIWKRTATSSTYIIDGKVYEKTGRTNVFELVDNCGFVQDNEGNVVNIQGSWDKLFPFDRNEPELFKLFEPIIHIPDSSKILTKMKKDDDEATKKIAEYNRQLQENTNKIELVKEYLTEVDNEYLKEQRDILKRDFIELNKLKKDCNDMQLIMTKLSSFGDLRNIPCDFIDINHYAKLKKDVEYLDSKEDILNFNRDIIDIDLTQIESYIKLKKDVDYLNTKEDILKFNKDIISLDNNLMDSYYKLKKDCEVISNIVSNIKQINSEIESDTENKNKIEEKLKDIKICPLCKQDIKHEHN